jgi:hypothetical protein
VQDCLPLPVRFKIPQYFQPPAHLLHVAVRPALCRRFLQQGWALRIQTSEVEPFLASTRPGQREVLVALKGD